MLCAPRVNDTFGWSDQFRFRLGLVAARQGRELVELDVREHAAERAGWGTGWTRLAGQNSVASKPNASLD